MSSLYGITATRGAARGPAAWGYEPARPQITRPHAGGSARRAGRGERGPRVQLRDEPAARTTALPRAPDRRRGLRAGHLRRLPLAQSGGTVARAVRPAPRRGRAAPPVTSTRR